MFSWVVIFASCATPVFAVPITVAGFNLDDTDFADIILVTDSVGTLEPGTILPDPGTDVATDLADAMLGSKYKQVREWCKR